VLFVLREDDCLCLFFLWRVQSIKGVLVAQGAFQLDMVDIRCQSLELFPCEYYFH